MLDDQPNCPETSTHGESVMMCETVTFSTLSPRMSFVTLGEILERPGVALARLCFSSSVSSSSRPSLLMQTSFLPSNS